jgi:hypothetical protein
LPEGKVTAFRLEARARKRLEEEAKRLGVPPGTLARRLVLEGLDREGALGPELERLRREVHDLQQKVAAGTDELGALNKNLWNATLALLARREPLTAAEANKWVREHLAK